MRFIVAPPLAGLASIAGAKEKRLSHASRSVGLDIILWRILRRTAAHVARAALGTLVMSGVQGGCCVWRMARLGCHLAAGSLEWAETIVDYFSVDSKIRSPEQPI